MFFMSKMSKFYNISFIILTLLNFIFLLAIYYLTHHRHDGHKIEDDRQEPKERMKNVVLVETDLGKIIGLQNQINSSKVNTFLGIPYAEPPIGQRRFIPPEPKAEWSNVLYARHWPNPCMQPDQSLQLNNLNFSEDCLYLNLWSPKNDGPNEPKPVVVIIHTGAFIFGSASEAKYNGLYLSYKASVVVVTFNYRLNFYGFFYSPMVTPNLGMLDQVLALKWIKQNIEKFNGDPNRITLIGQSSAALSIGMHITSPISRNLFQQAILMSGSPLQLTYSSEPEYVRQFWNNYIKHLKCDPNDEWQNAPSQLLRCLDDRIKSNRSNLITMGLVKQLASDKLFVNIPIVQDQLFQPASQLDLLEQWKQNPPKNFTLLYGYTNDEGSWISMLENPERFGPEVTPYLEQAEALENLEKLLDRMFFDKKINKTKIVKHYMENLLQYHRDVTGHGNDTWQMKTIRNRLISNMLGDRYIVCPMERFVQTMLDDQNETRVRRQLQIYQYLWKYKGDHRNSAFWNVFQKHWCGDWMGSCHSFEMFATFGIPFLEPMLFNQHDRLVSMKTIQIIKYFSWNRKLFWPPFQKDRKLFYEINADDNEDEMFVFGNNQKQRQCNRIWHD